LTLTAGGGMGKGAKKQKESVQTDATVVETLLSTLTREMTEMRNKYGEKVARDVEGIVKETVDRTIDAVRQRIIGILTEERKQK
jgi:hypothetical protein